MEKTNRKSNFKQKFDFLFDFLSKTDIIKKYTTTFPLGKRYELM